MGAGPARVRRGTQGHVAEPRGPARRAYVAIHIYYYIHIYKCSLSFPYWEGSYPYRSSGLINPHSIFSVGLTHTLFNMQNVARGGASDRDRSAPIKWTRGPEINQARALIEAL